jgi:cytochrome P450
VDADFEDAGMFPRIAEEMCSYFEELLARAAAPPGSVFHHLAAEVCRGALAREEMFAMTFLLLNAGFETSTALIASGVLALLEQPSQWTELGSDPSLVPSCVTELLRYVSPLEMSTPRFAAEDVTLAGRRLRRGDMVLVALGAANRDALRFPEPDAFGLRRENACQHLAFGFGAHYCLGAHLAQLVAEIAIAAFASAFPHARYDESQGSPSWDRGFVVRALSELRLLLSRSYGEV